MDPAAQIEHPDAAVSRHELAQRKVDRLALGARAGQRLSLLQDVVIDLDVGPYTPDDTPSKVY
jgi:hypothetical protein